MLFDSIGPGAHFCRWCSRPVAWHPGQGELRLVADHLDGDVRNNNPANLVASCHPCNATRGRRIPDDVLTVTLPNGRRRRAAEHTCLTCGVTFLRPLGAAERGEGRYCSMACVYDRKRGRSES